MDFPLLRVVLRTYLIDKKCLRKGTPQGIPFLIYILFVCFVQGGGEDEKSI